jgi:hypothetical protein
LPTRPDSADGNPPRLGGGQLLATISTNIVAIARVLRPRPTSAKTYVLDDIIVVVVMRGSGFIPWEKTIWTAASEPELVIAMREGFQRVMARRLKQLIKALKWPQRRRVRDPSPRCA